MLLDAVREVARAAGGADPMRVTQASWDANRAKAGRSDVPRAHSIAQRLRITWPQVLKLAHGRQSDALRALNSLQADKGRKRLTLPAISTALRQAALRLEQPGIDRGDYRRAREQILASSRRAHNATAERSLPTLTQIDLVLRQNNMNWAEALQLAGLGAPKRADFSGLDQETSLRLFADEVGGVPVGPVQLREWAAEIRKVSIVHPTNDGLKAAIVSLQASRADDGLPPLPVAARQAHRAAVTTTPLVGPRTRRREWTRAEIIDGLVAAIGVLDGQQLTQARLKAAAKDHPGQNIPSWSAVTGCIRRKHPDQTWEQWRREAERLATNAS